MDIKEPIAKKRFKKSFAELNLNQCAMVNSEIQTKGAVFGIYKLIRRKKRY